MQIILKQDENGYVIEPYGDEEGVETYWVSAEGTEKLWRAGWRPYLQPRVSRYTVAYLREEGHIRRWVWPPPRDTDRGLNPLESRLNPLEST